MVLTINQILFKSTSIFSVEASLDLPLI